MSNQKSVNKIVKCIKNGEHITLYAMAMKSDKV